MANHVKRKISELKGMVLICKEIFPLSRVNEQMRLANEKL